MWETIFQDIFGIGARSGSPSASGYYTAPTGGSPGAGGYLSGGSRLVGHPGAIIPVPPTVGSPGGGGYINVPTDIAVSRIDQPSRTTGIGGVLGGFANLSGFTNGADAFAFGFNPSLKQKDIAGGEVTADEIETSKNDAVVGATLASTGAGDFGISLPSVPGVNPGLVFVGLAGLALVGYSLLK